MKKKNSFSVFLHQQMDLNIVGFSPKKRRNNIRHKKDSSKGKKKKQKLSVNVSGDENDIELNVNGDEDLNEIQKKIVKEDQQKNSKNQQEYQLEKIDEDVIYKLFKFSNKNDYFSRLNSFGSHLFYQLEKIPKWVQGRIYSNEKRNDWLNKDIYFKLLGEG